MPKKPAQLHQIKEKVLVKVEIAVSVGLSDLYEVPDLHSVKDIKDKIIKQIDYSLRGTEGIEPVAYNVQILETNSRSVKKSQDIIKDED